MTNRLLSLLLVLLLLSPAAQAQQAPKQPDYKKKGAVIPPFLIKRTDGSSFSNTQLRAGIPTVLFIFSPSCDHCEKVMDSLKHRVTEFQNAQFVFVAEERQRPSMKAFLARTEVRNLPFFKNMGFDAANLIYFLYKYQALPQLNVYDSRGKLAHTFTSNIPLDSVKFFLK